MLTLNFSRLMLMCDVGLQAMQFRWRTGGYWGVFQGAAGLSASTGVVDESIQLSPHSIERLGHLPGVAQGFLKQHGSRAENHLGDFERFSCVPFFNLL